MIHQELILMPAPDGRAEHLPGPRATRAAVVHCSMTGAWYGRRPSSSSGSTCGSTRGAKVKDLKIAQQQMVAIAQALSFDASVLIMDEPTAALTDTEIDELFRIIRDPASARRRASSTSRTGSRSCGRSRTA